MCILHSKYFLLRYAKHFKIFKSHSDAAFITTSKSNLPISMHRRSRRREIMISAAMSDHFTRNLSDLLRQNRPPAIISRVPLWHARSLPFTKDTPSIQAWKHGFVTTNFAIVIVYISKRVYEPALYRSPGRSLKISDFTQQRGALCVTWRFSKVPLRFWISFRWKSF